MKYRLIEIETHTNYYKIAANSPEEAVEEWLKTMAKGIELNDGDDYESEYLVERLHE